MKIKIVVIVYDRLGNFLKWLRASKILNCDLTIIHNCNEEKLSNQWKTIAEMYNVSYIRRGNTGYDIGVFQEVCSQSLPGFDYNFDYLIWCTDDCIPTNKNLIELMTKPFSENSKLAVTCFEISREIRPHVRTTGFCIKKEVLKEITFPVPRILTKQNCYEFEHGQNNFLLQIQRKGFEALEIDNIFWNPDSRKIKQYGIEKSESERNRFLYNNEEIPIGVFSTACNRYPLIISSFLTQKYKNKFLGIYHDGKIYPYHKQWYSTFDNERITVFEMGETPAGNFGHPLRKLFLECARKENFEYLLITNEDNYIAPYFLSKAVEILERFPDKIGAYTSSMVHNYKSEGKPRSWREKQNIENGHIVDGYGLIPCRLERGFIDISAIVFRLDVCIVTGWNDFSHSSDWTFIETIVKNFGGVEKFVSIPGIHLVHN